MFVLASTAQAKVYHKGRVLVDMQISTIKGLLYDVSHTGKNMAATIQFRPMCAKALVWLDKVHASKTKTELTTLKRAEAELIKETIEIITEVIQGKFPNLLAGIAIPRWTNLGKRVIVEYSEKIVYDPVTKSKKKQIKWKFTLKPNPSITPKQKNKKTQHLIYRW